MIFEQLNILICFMVLKSRKDLKFKVSVFSMYLYDGYWRICMLLICCGFFEVVLFYRSGLYHRVDQSNHVHLNKYVGGILYSNQLLICNLLSNERMWVDGNVFDWDEVKRTGMKEKWWIKNYRWMMWRGFDGVLPRDRANFLRILKRWC